MVIGDDRFPNDNYYELRYKCGDYTCEVKFCSLISGDTLQNNLRDFLRGCSWSEDCLDLIFTKDEEEDIEDEQDE